MGLSITPHVAQNIQARRRSAINERYARHQGDKTSINASKRIEQGQGQVRPNCRDTWSKAMSGHRSCAEAFSLVLPGTFPPHWPCSGFRRGEGLAV